MTSRFSTPQNNPEKTPNPINDITISSGELASEIKKLRSDGGQKPLPPPIDKAMTSADLQKIVDAGLPAKPPATDPKPHFLDIKYPQLMLHAVPEATRERMKVETDKLLTVLKSITECTATISGRGETFEKVLEDVTERAINHLSLSLEVPHETDYDRMLLDGVATLINGASALSENTINHPGGNAKLISNLVRLVHGGATGVFTSVTVDKRYSGAPEEVGVLKVREGAYKVLDTGEAPYSQNTPSGRLINRAAEGVAANANRITSHTSELPEESVDWQSNVALEMVKNKKP